MNENGYRREPLTRQSLGRIGRTFLRRSAGGVLSWLKAQLSLFFVGIGIMMFGFYLLDISWWGMKAVLISIIDVLPLIGSGLIMIPWAILRLLGGDGSTALWLIVIYLALIITRQILEPIIIGRSIGLKPFWSFLATLIGIIAFGPIGAIIGAFCAILIRVVLTIREDYRNGYFDPEPIVYPSEEPLFRQGMKDAGHDSDIPD